MMGRSATIAVLLLVASVATASGECAWVLWQKWGPVWFLEGATPSYEDCRAAARRETERRQQAGALVDRDGNVRSWDCLPDTIDPRGPKTK